MKRQFTTVMVFACTIPNQALAQQLGGGSDVGVPILRILTGLIVSVLVAGLVALLLRARSSGKALNEFGWLPGIMRKGRIEIIESRRIGAQTDAALMRCDGIEYLILLAPSGPSVLERRLIEAEDGHDAPA